MTLFNRKQVEEKETRRRRRRSKRWNMIQSDQFYAPAKYANWMSTCYLMASYKIINEALLFSVVVVIVVFFVIFSPTLCMSYWPPYSQKKPHTNRVHSLK